MTYIQYSNTDVINNTTSILIPTGPKYLATFKEENNKPLCILYDIENKIHKNIYVSFDPILTLGTVIYGTLINDTFICENIITHKNKKINEGYQHSYELIEYILNNYICFSKVKGVYNFKLPYTTNNEPVFAASELNYNIYGIIQLRPKPFLYKLSKLFGNFIIYKHPELMDVYGLYVMNDNVEFFYGNAFINDIKTSYLLRKVFRNKTTYKNIEYSDDESDEPVVEKAYITCIYLHSYKKWKPYKYNHKKMVDTYKRIKSYT